MQRGEHAGDLVVFAPPSLRCRRIEVAEIAAIQHPHRISSAEPIAMTKKRRNSGFESRCRPKPSAKLAQIDFDARLIWSASAHCSIRGKSRLTR